SSRLMAAKGTFLRPPQPVAKSTERWHHSPSGDWRFALCAKATNAACAVPMVLLELVMGTCHLCWGFEWPVKTTDCRFCAKLTVAGGEAAVHFRRSLKRRVLHRCAGVLSLRQATDRVTCALRAAADASASNRDDAHRDSPTNDRRRDDINFTGSDN